MPRKVLVALPEGMIEMCDFIAQVEHRTRSDLVREALRRYIDNFRRNEGGRLHVSQVSKIELADDGDGKPPVRPSVPKLYD